MDRDALAREMWFNVWPADEDAKDYNWRYAVEHNLTDAVFVCANIAMRHIEAARAEERARCADIAETMRLDCMANGVRDVCTTAMVGTAATLRDAIRAGSPAPAAPVVWQDITTAPMDTDVMLGWWVTWPECEWKVEYSWAGKSNSCPPGISNAWLHGQATHWCAPTLPEPPRAALEAASREGK